MKKLLIALALVFAVSALFGEKPKFEVIKPAKTVTVKNMPAFVEQKLPAMISLKSPLFKGTIQNSNTISGTSTQSFMELQRYPGRRQVHRHQRERRKSCRHNQRFERFLTQHETGSDS